MSIKNHAPALLIERTRQFYYALNAGDPTVIEPFLTPDAEWFMLDPRDKPLKGAAYIARYWSKVVRQIGADWHVEHAIASGNEVVAEWSMSWNSEGGNTHVTHGAEWYVFDGDRIAELRAYYRFDPQGDSGLTGFPYSERGYRACRFERGAVANAPSA